ncbi:unnamed protein product [Closterium sp. NIES-53]
MTSLRVLAFDHEGRPFQFDTWLDDLQLYLLSDSKDSVSLFDLASGAATAPPATADSSTRSQWLTRDAAARLAIRNHLPLAECAHFRQHRTWQAVYGAVVARYSSPATVALGRLLLPYLFPELSAFTTIEDLSSHLRASDARYRAAVRAEFLDRNPPPMYITLYFIVTRLSDSLRSVRDHFFSLDPTSLIVDLLKQHLLAVETSAVAVGVACGTLRPPFFEGCSPSPLAPTHASAAAANVSVPKDVGAASASAKRRSSKGKGGRGGGGGSGGGGGGSVSGGGGSSGGGGGGAIVGGSGGGGSGGSGGSGGGGTGSGGTGTRRVGSRGGQHQQQQRSGETPSPQQLREWFLRGASAGSCPYVIRTSDRAGQTCGRLHTQHRCFSRLDDAWRAEFGDDVELPCWADLLKSRIAIFDADFDAILSAMYALSVSAEGDCYRCVPPDPGIAVAALGASESGTLPGTAPAEALHTFTLDSGASRCFFRDSTTLTPLPTPFPVRLADPSGGLVVAHSSTVLPCSAVQSGSLSGLHLPSFSTNLVSTAALQDAMVTTTTPEGQRVSICTCIWTGHHLATFTHRPGLSMFTLTTEPSQVATAAQVSASGQVAASCSCRLLSHQTLLWHHCLGHPSLPRLCGMHSRLLVSSLPRSLPPLPPSPAPPCLRCVEGRQHAAPHSSFPPTTAPVQTLHMDVWGPARVSGKSCEHYFQFVVDDYTRYTTVFPLRSKGQVIDVLIPWIRTVRLQLRERFGQDLPVLRLHSDRGGEFSFNHLRDFCRGEGILLSFTLLDSFKQNRISECRIGLVMETSPTLRWTGEVGDASVYWVWVSRAFVHDTSADKLSPRAIPCIFLGFVPDAPGRQFYHPTSRRVFPSQDVTFDESVPLYRLFPYRSAPPPPPPLFLAPDPLPGPAPVQVAIDSGAARGAASRGVEPGGAESEGAETRGAEPRGVETGGAELGGVEPGGVEPGGAASEGAESRDAEPQGAASSRGSAGASPCLSPQQMLEWFVRRTRLRSGASGAGGAGAAGAGGARTRGTRAARTGGVEGAGAGVLTESDPTESDHTGAGGVGVGGLGVGEAGAGGAGPFDPGGTVRPRPYFVPLLQQVLGTPPSAALTPPLLCPPPDQSQPPLQPASPLPAPSYTEQSSGHTERREPASRPVFPVCTARRVPRSRPPPVRGTHAMTLRPSSVPLHVPLPAPPESSLPEVPDPASDRARTASPTVSRLLATGVTDPSFETAATTSASPPSVGGLCSLGTDVLEDRQEEFECLAAAVPRFASMLLALEGDPDAPEIPTPRSYAEAMTGTYVDEVPPPGTNIVDGILIFGHDYELHYLDFSTAFLQGSQHEEIWLRRPPGFTESFPADTLWSLRRPVYGLRQAPREWHDTLRTTLAALGFAPATADPSLFLRTDTSLPPFYVLVYVDDLVFATADTEDLQRFGFQFSSPQPTPLSTSHSLSAPPLDESVEPSGPYPELVGCLMYLMTCTRPVLAYPLCLLARYVAPCRHQKVHWDAAKRVLRYLCSTSGMGLVLGGRGPVVLTGHAGTSWVDDSATQRLSQCYTFSLGSGSVSWRSTRSSSVLSSSCEAEIYAWAMAAQELGWLTYLLMDLREQPRSPPVLYVDNKAMVALCQEHSLEHRTKHIALRYFLARELQLHGQLPLAYVATRANTADVFTKALPPACFAFLDWSCDHLFSPTLPMGCVNGPEEESDGEEERRRFHSLVGSLMYAVVNTRPDVALATGQLARVVQCPNEEQVAAGMRVANYLGLQSAAAVQRRQKGADGVERGRLFLTAFSDASDASEPEDMTSVGGFIGCVGGGPTALESKKQLRFVKTTGQPADMMAKRLVE